MKKLVSVILISCLLLLCSCNSTEGWKTIKIENYGSIKVPENWEFSVVDGYMYISSNESGESKNVLVQFRDDVNNNKEFDDIEDFQDIVGEFFSNSTGITKYKVLYKDGSSAEKFVLYFTSSDDYKSTEFICLDDSVSEDVLKKIAKSYVMD
ncbi:MAG: hypothetical protein IJO58_06095 [Clostridia bacterium]|nr:hypothetical protein [Clostridia bacterium]